LLSVEFADAGTKSGAHRVRIIGRGSEGLEAGDIGLSLEEAKTLVSAIESEFVSAQAAEIVEARRQCNCRKKLAIQDWKLRRIHTTFCRVYLPSPRVMSCTCNPVQRRAISRLGWLTRSTNELRYLAAKRPDRRTRDVCSIRAVRYGQESKSQPGGDASSRERGYLIGRRVVCVFPDS
jgi:hypothetical protein